MTQLSARLCAGRHALPAVAAALLAAGCAGSGTGTSSPTATGAATQSAPPTPTGPAVTDLFLPPEQAASAEEPGWSVDQAYQPRPGPLVDPCDEGGFPRADDVAASDERAISSQREAGGSELVQEVFRYSSASAAEQAYEEYVAQVERCPQRPARDGPSDWTVRSETVLAGASGDVRRLLVREVPCMAADACTEHFATYLVVAQTGDRLTAASYGIGEDGDPQDGARALLDALAERLATAG